MLNQLSFPGGRQQVPPVMQLPFSLMTMIFALEGMAMACFTMIGIGAVPDMR